MKKNTGFTLIELMIVVAIIAIIAAIAIPNLLRSRMAGNEASAIGNLRAVAGAQISYHAAKATFAADLPTLASADNTPKFLDGDWAEATVKGGYVYVMTGDTTTFSCTATPSSASTGSRAFLVDASGVILWVAGTDACTVATGTPLGQAAAAAAPPAAP